MIVGIIGSVAVVAVLVLIGVPVYLAWLAGTSLVLFLFYGLDKRRAINGGRRIPEIVLHGLAMAGGFAGGWAGRSVFRHKTLRTSFTLVLTAATLLHIGIFLLTRW